MFIVDLQFNDKKMRAVVPALLFCAVRRVTFSLSFFFLGLKDVFVRLFLIPSHIVVGFCMTGKSALEFGQSSDGP
jgi:hypothetical protein